MRLLRFTLFSKKAVRLHGSNAPLGPAIQGLDPRSIMHTKNDLSHPAVTGVLPDASDACGALYVSFTHASPLSQGVSSKEFTLKLQEKTISYMSELQIKS
jgi:hypothetical protein